MRNLEETYRRRWRHKGRAQEGTEDYEEGRHPHQTRAVFNCDAPTVTDGTSSQYIINAQQPTQDRIFDPSAFTTFLQQRIKVDGLTGNLGDSINVTNLNDGRIEIVAHREFSGRYIKYLTKKFLKKQQLRDWLRVVSTSKGEYSLKFFNVVGDEGEEEED